MFNTSTGLVPFVGDLSSPNSNQLGGGKPKGGGFMDFLNNPLTQLGIGTLFQELDLGRNLSLVQQYGLSSWGASTDPQNEKATFQPYIEQEIERLLTQMNEQNAGEVLTELDRFLSHSYTGKKHLREHHTNARSSKIAKDQSMAFVKKVRTDVLNDVVSKLRNAGFKVSSVSKSGDHQSDVNVVTSYRDYDRTHLYTYRWNEYNVIAPEKSVLDDLLGTDNVDSALGGTTTTQAGLGWLIGLFAIGWFFGLVKIKKNAKSPYKKLR